MVLYILHQDINFAMFWCMRTTVTLDDDVAALLKRERARRKESLRKVVNEALREGLRRRTTRPPATALYRTPSVSLGRCLIASLDDIEEALAVSEEERFP